MTKKKIVLEQATLDFLKEAEQPPYLYQIPPEEGRKEVDQVQAENKVPKQEVEETSFTLETDFGSITVYVLRPPHAEGTLPVILYSHGAGWVFGNKHTHDYLIRELCIGSNSAIVFPEFSLSPEAQYPVAIEQIYATLEWISQQANEQQFDLDKLIVAGDSVGGNMSAVITLLSKERKGPKISKQLLFYPVTNAAFDTASYNEFANGYFLHKDGMKWFWNQYTTDENLREQITASPLRATKEQLTNLPPALIITGEADVLRDEGEAYGNLLREAGVDVLCVRIQGIIHDFVMLHPLAETQAAKGALLLANSWLKA